MLSMDRFVISESLTELGFNILSKYAKQEQCEKVMKGYVSIIVRECFNKKRKDVEDILINSGLLTRPEFFIILSRIHGGKYGR